MAPLTVFNNAAIESIRNYNSKKYGLSKKEANRGAWIKEEDKKLTEAIAIHGPKKWKAIATNAGLNRCGKSCRLRWMNYLRPNIKRGNISDEEEDLIIRMHKLLGNKWTLIAGRVPGRTDNEIKNYWNSHLSKKIKKKQIGGSSSEGLNNEGTFEADAGIDIRAKDDFVTGSSISDMISFDVDEFFDFSTEGTLNLEWVSKFLELDS